MRDALKVAVPAGTGPDIALGIPHDWMGNLVAAAVLKTINLSATTSASLTPASIGIFQSGGKQYGVPFYTENVALVRNLKVAPKAPATGADIKNGELQVGTYGSTSGDPYHFYAIQSSFGAPVFDFTSKGWSSSVAMSGPAGEKFATYLATKGQKFFGPANASWNDVVCKLRNGKIKYWLTGPWAISSIEGGNSSCTGTKKINKDFAVSAIPSFGGQTAQQFLGGKGGILTNSPNTDVVFGNQLLNHLASEASGTSYFTTDSFTPANKAALKKAMADPVIAAFAAAGKNAVPMPNNALMDTVFDKWGKTEAKILTGKSTNPVSDWRAMTSALTEVLKN
jgi:arabinogalactan oligomer/maltooligosaccharide transport system substrate-binding protein